MSNCKSFTSPLVAHFKISSKTCPTSAVKIEKMSHVPYSSAVGSLMHAVVYSRPDLTYTISIMCRYMHFPGKNYGEAVK